jgi:hypothetical protein
MIINPISIFTMTPIQGAEHSHLGRGRGAWRTIGIPITWESLPAHPCPSLSKNNNPL